MALQVNPRVHCKIAVRAASTRVVPWMSKQTGATVKPSNRRHSQMVGIHPSLALLRFSKGGCGENQSPRRPMQRRERLLMCLTVRSLVTRATGRVRQWQPTSTERIAQAFARTIQRHRHTVEVRARALQRELPSSSSTTAWRAWTSRYYGSRGRKQEEASSGSPSFPISHTARPSPPLASQQRDSQAKSTVRQLACKEVHTSTERQRRAQRGNPMAMCRWEVHSSNLHQCRCLLPDRSQTLRADRQEQRASHKRTSPSHRRRTGPHRLAHRRQDPTVTKSTEVAARRLKERLKMGRGTLPTNPDLRPP